MATLAQELQARPGDAGRSLLRSFEHARWVVPALLVLALSLRVALMMAFPQEAYSDGEWYMARAAEMSAGLGYQESGHPTAFWPVGYPAAAAASIIVFGPGLAGPLILNLIAAALILLLLLWFGRHVAGSELAGRIAILLYAIYPAHIAYTGAPLAETVSTAILMAAFALLIKAPSGFHRFVTAGLLFGAATLIRPQFVLFPAGALVVLWLAGRDLKWRNALSGTLALYVALFAVVLPWSLRNVDQLGSFVFVSTNGGVALVTGANDLATGEHMYVEHSPIWAEVGIPWEQRVVRQVEIDARLKDIAKQWIAEHPGDWLALGFRKMAYLWSKDTDGFWALAGTYPDRQPLWSALQWANQGYYLLVLGLGFIAFAAGALGFVRRREDEARLLLLACAPIFVTLLAFGFSGQTRYHHPAMPFVLVAAAWTIAHAWRRLTPSR